MWSFVHGNSEKLQPERTKAGPLCMSQYLNLYSCCRIPGKEVDTQRISPIEESRHIIVTHNDHVSCNNCLTVLHVTIVYAYCEKFNHAAKYCFLSNLVILSKSLIPSTSGVLEHPK